MSAEYEVRRVGRPPNPLTGGPHSTAHEIALLMSWRRRGALKLLRGYYRAAQYRVDWCGLDHGRILDYIRTAIFEIETDISRQVYYPAENSNPN